jgi:hypothetical protein
MFDIDRCVRCTRLSRSFFKQPLQSLADAMDPDQDAAKAAEMTKQWKEAENALSKIEDGETLDWPSSVKIHQHLKVGYRMSRKFGFMSLGEFLDEMEVEAKTLIGLRIVTKWNEEGTRKIEGIAFRPVEGDEMRHRIYETFAECIDEQETSILEHDQRLREKEPEETMKRLAKDASAEHPLVTRGMS